MKIAFLWLSNYFLSNFFYVFQKEVCEVLHSYICSVKEKGSIPALHASEHLALENSVLISSQSGKPSIPKVEWAHHSTDLQIGDRYNDYLSLLHFEWYVWFFNLVKKSWFSQNRTKM